MMNIDDSRGSSTLREVGSVVVHFVILLDTLLFLYLNARIIFHISMRLGVKSSHCLYFSAQLPMCGLMLLNLTSFTAFIRHCTLVVHQLFIYIDDYTILDIKLSNILLSYVVLFLPVASSGMVLKSFRN